MSVRLQTAINDLQTVLSGAQISLAARRTEFTERLRLRDELQQTDLCTLDVGGQPFTVPVAHFGGDHFFSAMLAIPNSDPVVFIDRCPEMFPHILAYLRNNGRPHRLLRRHTLFRARLFREARYYGINELAGYAGAAWPKLSFIVVSAGRNPYTHDQRSLSRTHVWDPYEPHDSPGVTLQLSTPVIAATGNGSHFLVTQGTATLRRLRIWCTTAGSGRLRCVFLLPRQVSAEHLCLAASSDRRCYIVGATVTYHGHQSDAWLYHYSDTKGLWFIRRLRPTGINVEPFASLCSATNGQVLLTCGLLARLLCGKDWLVVPPPPVRLECTSIVFWRGVFHCIGAGRTHVTYSHSNGQWCRLPDLCHPVGGRQQCYVHASDDAYLVVVCGTTQRVQGHTGGGWIDLPCLTRWHSTEKILGLLGL